jgi:hypothetical protein
MAYPVVAALKTFMGVTAAGEDANLTIALAAAVAEFERATNRIYVETTETKTFRVVDPFVTQRGRCLTLFQDLQSVTTLTNGDGIEIAAADYDLVPGAAPYDQIILTKYSGLRFWDGGDGTQISVAGKWGYSADVPADVLRELLVLGKYMYESSRQGVGGVVQSSGRQSGLTMIPADWPESVKLLARLLRRYSV